MTEQYQQNSINIPRGAVSYETDANLTLDSDMVTASTVNGVITLVLPSAAQIPAQEIKIKANDAGTTGNAVRIATQPGEFIDDSSTVSLTVDEETLFVKSDGQNWRTIGIGTSGSSCCPPEFTYPGGTALITELTHVPSVVISIGGSNLSGITTITPKFDPNVGAATLPTVNGFIVNSGTDTILDSIDIDLDTSAAVGEFVLEVLNDCGCTNLIRIFSPPA